MIWPKRPLLPLSSSGKITSFRFAFCAPWLLSFGCVKNNIKFVGSHSFNLKGAVSLKAGFTQVAVFLISWAGSVSFLRSSQNSWPVPIGSCGSSADFILVFGLGFFLRFVFFGLFGAFFLGLLFSLILCRKFLLCVLRSQRRMRDFFSRLFFAVFGRWFFGLDYFLCKIF